MIKKIITSESDRKTFIWLENIISSTGNQLFFQS